NSSKTTDRYCRATTLGATDRKSQARFRVRIVGARTMAAIQKLNFPHLDAILMTSSQKVTRRLPSIYSTVMGYGRVRIRRGAVGEVDLTSLIMDGSIPKISIRALAKTIEVILKPAGSRKFKTILQHGRTGVSRTLKTRTIRLKL